MHDIEGIESAPRSFLPPQLERRTSSDVVLLSTDFTDGADGFVYKDDAFLNTEEPSYADGNYEPGFLLVEVGGVNNADIDRMSGGWVRDITLTDLAELKVQFTYQVSFSNAYDDGEYAQVLCSVDGTLYGPDIDDSIWYIDMTILQGISDWRSATFTAGPLAAGVHSLAIGLYNNRKTTASEISSMWISEVSISENTGNTLTLQPSEAPPPAPFVQGTTTLLRAGFDEDNLDGFVFETDVFLNTAEPEYANGFWDSTEGTAIVELGGIDQADIYGMSGGFLCQLTLSETSTLSVSLDVSVFFSGAYDEGEYSQVLLSLGDKLYGLNGEVYLWQFESSSVIKEMGWTTVELNLGTHRKGNYTLAMGGYNNAKTTKSEATLIKFDNVVITSTGSPDGDYDLDPSLAPSGVPTSRPSANQPSTSHPTELLSASESLSIAPSAPNSFQPSITIESSMIPSGPSATQPTASPPELYSLQPSILKESSISPSYMPSVSPKTVSSPSLPYLADFSADVSGFTFAADVFHDTSEPFYSDGFLGSAAGQISGALQVVLGGIDNYKVTGMSGGWTLSFEVYHVAQASLHMTYSIDFSKAYDDGEFSDILCTLNDKFVGVDGNDYIARYTTQVLEGTSPWTGVTVPLGLMVPGSYTLILGGYNNQKTSTTEKTIIYFDRVEITAADASLFPTMAPSMSAAPTVTVAPTDYVAVRTYVNATFLNDAEGFIYSDCIFRDCQEPDYAEGSYTSLGGENGGGLEVHLGGIDNDDIYFISGGFTKAITLDSSKQISMALSYTVSFGNYEAGEYSEVLVSCDGELVGLDENDYIDRIDEGQPTQIPWTHVTLELGTLGKGSHTIALGGFSFGKTASNEETFVYFDNVIVLGTDPPSAAPSMSSAPTYPSPAPSAAPGWETVDTTGVPTERHEACFVMVNEKGYLIGGRGIKPVDEYDPLTRTWTQKTGPGIELHHMQCVVYQDEVFIVSSWTGNYPSETNTDAVYVYNTVSDTWSTNRTPLPEDRRRGGAAAVLVGDEIYVSHGNVGGHGEHSTTLGWLDKYNILEDTWTTHLPDAPNPRDHTGGSMVGNRLCVAGGRDGSAGNFFISVVLPTDCYNFETGTWEVEAKIPQGRAGSAYGETCDGKLMIAGGEGFGRAWDYVDVFDGSGWKSMDSLNHGRHGTGLAISCTTKQIHIASGAGDQGGEPELSTVETLFPPGHEIVYPS